MLGLDSSRGLAPLEYVLIESYTMSTNEIDDIAFAFSDTLQSIIVSDDIQPGPHPTIRIGKGWVDLPLLTHLSLYIPRNRLLVDELMLSHCPNLTYVEFSDHLDEYSCQDIVPTLPVHLGQLMELKLQGWPALTFHPATLHSTTKLRSMRISSSYFYRAAYYIPPIEELNQSYGIGMDSSLRESGTENEATTVQRPLWTWDWTLPHLGSVELTGEFAYLFQFRMLCGCPSLVSLTLKMNTRQSNHTRVITQSDFYATTDNTTTTYSGRSPNTRRIVAPCLEELCFTGNWEIDGSLLGSFFHDMFPRLRDAALPGLYGFGPDALAQCLKTRAKHVVTLGVGIDEPSEEEQRKYGLYPRKGRMRNFQDIWHFVRFRGVEYIILRDHATAGAAAAAVASTAVGSLTGIN
jgi:hypothetical protein